MSSLKRSVKKFYNELCKARIDMKNGFIFQTTLKRMVLFQQLDKHLIPFLRQEMRRRQKIKGWSDKETRERFAK